MEKNTKNEMKKKNKVVRPMLLAACVAVVGLSVYADWNYNKNKEQASEKTGYIYNSSVSGDSAKILGEATYVGATPQEETASSNQGDIVTEESYFASAAYERQRSRDETLELLQTVVDSSETMPDAKNKALSDMTALAAAMEAETNIETLVKAKGFDDCIAVISGDNINVVVKTTGLLTYEVAQIREIVMNEMKIPAENIKIIEKTK